MRLSSTCAGAVGLGLVVVIVLRLPQLAPSTVSYVSDLGQLAAALAATVGCAVASRRSTGQRTRSWAWLGAGAGCWAAGQAVWSWYELVLGRAVPFPSLADVGFLLCPVAMGVGLVTWLGSQGSQLAARGRDLLDGAVIAVSLLVLSWVTALGSVVRTGADSWLPLSLSLAYPVGDLIVATLVLMALARGTRGERGTLVALALGLGGLAVSDSAYVYLVGVGAYSSASVVSSGWVVGFLLVAAAGLGRPVPRAVPVGEPSGPGTGTPVAVRDASLLRLTTPYAPLVAAGAVLVVTLLRAPMTSTVSVLLGVALVLLVLSRQFLDVVDNRRLLTALGVTRDQLHHQATHDALTGLANRTLFEARLHDLLQHPGADVTVLYCDLDDFKLVNDQHGHDVGDEVLRVVARRLRTCVRAEDTVARLGGDEFAVLVDAGRAVAVAERVIGSLREPVRLGGQVLSTTASVGIAHHRGVGRLTGDERPPGSTRLRELAEQEALAASILREADAAMYAAKRSGKGRAVLADPPPLTA